MRMAEKWSNVLSSLVYSAIGVELLRIVTGSNNSELFSIAIKPLVKRINRQGVSDKKTNRVIWNYLTIIKEILVVFVKISRNC